MDRFFGHAAGNGMFQQFPVDRLQRGKGCHDSGGFFPVEMNDQLFISDYLRIRYLRPVEDLEILSGFEEGKDLNAEGSQDEVGVADTVQGETEEDKSSWKGCKTPPRGKKEFIQ